jgi:hypothetical protein
MTFSPANQFAFVRSRSVFALTTLAFAGASAFAADLRTWPSQPFCDERQYTPSELPAAAEQRLPQSQVVQGRRDIGWAWLGSPSSEYPHATLGSSIHAGSVHVQASPAAGGGLHDYLLPKGRVYEDRVPRLIDLDNDGRDELVLIESDEQLGSALVVLGLRAQIGSTTPALREIARGPFVGQPFRWLNPVGAADFDGDGRLELVSVTTPHTGGLLTMYRFQPPRLIPLGEIADISNHRINTLEQQMATIAKPTTPGVGPAVLASDSSYRKLRALRWKPLVPAAGQAAAMGAAMGAAEAPEGRWEDAAPPVGVRSPLQRLLPLPGGGCAQLQDSSWWRVTYTP